ncbi:MAG: FtsX-like permease family protein [Ruminococcaceae bacterium]|nr:FtsX-like permease family protein [Oscillospiraceae bacterium]
MRSFLTMLGIIIGVAAVITLVSIVSGFSEEMLSSFESMGTNKISVNIIGRGSSRNVEPDEMHTLAKENPELIEYVTPTVSIQNATIKSGSTNITSSITGVNEYYDEIDSKNIETGRFLTYLDVEHRLKRCVIGTYISQELFGTKNGVGQTLKINGTQFTVAGVFEETAGSEDGSTDDIIVIPYTVAQKLSYNGKISSYTFTGADKDKIDITKKTIENFLYSKFEDTNAYLVISMAEAVDIINELMGMVSSILIGIAAISLLVGGIGIMNIMLVSVTERTREIGIRKALGATGWDILSQFVVEAITTSAVGGIIGIILGIFCAKVLANSLGLPSAISATSVLVAFSVSAGIGVAFGYLPAKKAAKMNPIDALRHD